MENKKFLLYGLISVVSLAVVIGLVILVTSMGARPAATGEVSGVSETSVVSDVSTSSQASSVVGSSSAPEESSSSQSVSSQATSSQTVTAVDGPAQSKVPAASSQSTSSAASQTGGYTREELAADLDEWNLFLVNPDYTIEESWAPADLTSVGNDQSIDSRIYSAYRAMVSAAEQDGVSLWVVSGYRSYSKQTRLYNNRVARSKEENPSFTQEEAEADAAMHVARPGTSEHQIGLAIDFNSVETSFADTKAGKWLKSHAAEYGFILRYEEDKQSITKVTYEPWHYRYVGAKHALTMQEKGMCLEEYIDWLKGN